jgi:N-hydroxyarylamine O-acetyltransferase
MNVDRYLERIGLAGREPVGHAFLARLQLQHLLTVPFENLDILAGRPIALDLQRIYDKIVAGRRGGFCYELNGLFAWLLGQLGYDVNMVSARAWSRKDGRFGPEFDHMALLVRLDRKYLADVGFGDCFREPIPLLRGSVNDVSGTYRIEPASERPSVFTLEKFVDGEWTSVYLFSTVPRALSEYRRMCGYHQTSPDTHFTQRSICTMATRTGRVSLSGDFLTITDGQDKRKIPCASVHEHRRLLREYFGIVI